MEKIKLNNGVEMPVLGLGTFLLKPQEAEEAVYNALKCGYRLIDTSNAYMNERAVGRGIKKSGIPREEIFLESKLWPTVYTKETAVDEMLERLAWYPLGHGDKGLIEEPIFTELAQKYGKSNAQIILRCHVQSGNIVIPGSKNPEHIKDNGNIFDFKLSDEEMNEIAKVNKNKRYYIPDPAVTASYAKMELNPEADV